MNRFEFLKTLFAGAITTVAAPLAGVLTLPPKPPEVPQMTDAELKAANPMWYCAEPDDMGNWRIIERVPDYKGFSFEALKEKI